MMRMIRVYTFDEEGDGGITCTLEVFFVNGEEQTRSVEMVRHITIGVWLPFSVYLFTVLGLVSALLVDDAVEK